MAKRLTKLQLDRIDVVDKGANPGAHITLVKRFVEKAAKTKSVGGTELPSSAFAYVGDPEDTSTWKLPVHDASHARNALARFNQTEGIPSGEKAKVHAKIVAAAQKHGVDVSKAGPYTCDECGAQFSTQAALDAHEASAHDEDDMAKHEDEIAALTKRAETAEHALAELKTKTEKPDPLAKAAPEVKEAIAKAMAEAAEAKEQVTKLQDERDRDTFIRKAAAYGRIMKADDFGPILRKVAKALTSEEFTALETRLRAVQKQLETNVMFREAGLDGGEAATSIQKLDGIAAEIRKRDPKLSHEQAYAQALDTPEGKALYAESLSQTPRGEE